MAKKSAVERDKKRARWADKYASRRARLKAAAKDPNLSPEDRFNARLKLAEIPRNAAPNRQRLRCELTGRPRGNYRKFGYAGSNFVNWLLPGKSPAWSSPAGKGIRLCL